MKDSLIILIFTLHGLQCMAQNRTSWTELDTLERFDNKTLVNYRTYHDSILIEEAQAFLFKTTIKVPRYRLLPSILKIKVEADSIVCHGERKTFLDNCYYKSEKYNQGVLLTTEYYNDSGHLMNGKEFRGNHITFGPCSSIIGHYFIYGKKKKK